MRMFFLRTVMVLLGIRERRIVVPQAAHLAVSSAPPARFDPGNMHSRALRSLLAVPDAPPRFIDPGNMHSRALQALLAVPDAPPRFIAHWARSAPIPQGALGSDPTGYGRLRRSQPPSSLRAYPRSPAFISTTSSYRTRSRHHTTRAAPPSPTPADSTR